MSHQSNMNQLRTSAVSAVSAFLQENKKAATSTNRISRFKLERGHSALCRFLPFEFGPRKNPFGALVGQHWIGKGPVDCKRHTHPDFGGDPNYDCPICEVSEAMWAAAEDQDEKDDFYRAQAREVFRMFILMILEEDDRGNQHEFTEDQIVVPYEFNIPKASYQTLATKIERSQARKGGDPDLGLLNLETGTDIWVQRDKKNSLLFDLSENGPQPAFPLDDTFDVKIAKIWKMLKDPQMRFLPEDRMVSIANMLQEKAFDDAAKEANERGDRRSSRGGRGSAEHDEDTGIRGNGRSGGRSYGRVAAESNEQEQVVEERPAARPAARTVPTRTVAAPSRRMQQAQEALEDSHPDLAPAPAPEDAPPENAQAEESVPTRRSAPPTRSMVARAAAPAETQEEPPQSEPMQQEEPPQEVRRAVGARPAPVRSAAPAAAPVSAIRRSAPAVSAGRPAGPVEDESEHLPEEQNDPAPPSREALPPRSVASATVAAAAPTGQTRLIAALGPRISKLKAQQA